MTFTQKKFLSLPPPQQHKKCAEILRRWIASRDKSLPQTYQQLCCWLQLPYIDCHSFETVEERFHLHVRKSGRGISESDFLLTCHDKEEALPWLNIHTYLDGLRSCHNVGSIIRTIEAFRLGPLHFSKDMMPLDHPQIQKTSMGTFQDVPKDSSVLDDLPRPWIGIETVLNAPKWNEYLYSTPCTLILGNEERGIQRQILEKCDIIVHVPLRGCKNSLNVANAFAIIAAQAAYINHEPIR